MIKNPVLPNEEIRSETDKKAEKNKPQIDNKDFLCCRK
jgi:hypothetical protein